MQRDGRRSSFRCLRIPALGVLLLLVAFPSLAAAEPARELVPIGGGYAEATLQGFARAVIDHADGDVVKILVVPSSYGKDPQERDENIILAQERTDQVEAACDAGVDTAAFPGGCDADLLLLFNRSDAMDPANSAAFYDDEVDGAFVLGGDQMLAMTILAKSPAEEAMAHAAAQGVVFGGTSAGAAVQSRTMLASYTWTGWPYNALERNQIIIWWPNGEGGSKRGLTFGSEATIMDQHFYQRGRFGRLLNAVAQTDEYFGGDSLLGVGADYETGVRLSNDSLLSGVFGNSSVAIIDFEAAGATHDWVGPNHTLSARDVVTHIVGPGPFGYDVAARAPLLAGNPVPFASPGAWPDDLLAAPGDATLILGGDVSLDWGGAPLREFVVRAGQSGSGTILVIVAAASDPDAVGQDYTLGLEAAGWKGKSERVEVVSDPLSDPDLPDKIGRAAGVLFVGADQSLLAPIMTNRFRNLVLGALERAPVVMTDRAMTAAMGEWYVADPEPTDDDYQEEAIADFQVGGTLVKPGLRIVAGAAFEPRVTYDQRWGRLYSVAMRDPDTIVFGLSEMTGLVLDGGQATVAGERSVIALDARGATFHTEQGVRPVTAFNVVMDLFGPGDAVAPAR